MKFFDLHCDTLVEAEKKGEDLYENSLHLSVKRGRAYAPWIQCFAVWLSDDYRGEEAERFCDRMMDRFFEETERLSLKRCVFADDFCKIKENKEAGAVLTLEGAAALNGKLSRLEELHKKGVKAITLTWNGSNELGDGAMVKQGKGLTEFGRQAVSEMERLHIAVDVSHASDRMFYDVAQMASKPFIATHSNSRRLCRHPRNLTDEQFCAIRDSGGIVGINFYPPFLSGNGRAGLEDIVRHTEHFLSLGGESTLCIGSDFDGASMPEGINGIESIELLYEHFLRRNYREDFLDALFFENAFHFFQTL